MKRILSSVLALFLLFNLAACTPPEGSATVSSSSVSTSSSPSTVNPSISSEVTGTPTTSNPMTTSKPSTPTGSQLTPSVGTGTSAPVKLSSIPAYSNKAYVTLNNNIPNFSAAELTTKGYEKYSPLDSKGRCGVAIASCGKEIMPKDGEERGSISAIKPTGWVQAQYSGISGGYLWNRCHLIGWQLSAENANKQNLITGTRYMNTEGMLPFENMVADYIRETGNHVAYRITPLFEGNNLVCSGVQMEAYSIEDNGEGICFNVYCYNVQPGIKINYATGASTGPSSSSSSSKPASSSKPTVTSNATTQTQMVWVSKTGKKYHSYSSCSNMKNASQVTKSEAESRGLTPCSKCY